VVDAGTDEFEIEAVRVAASERLSDERLDRNRAIAGNRPARQGSGEP
jgi:hypothetical protein